MKIGGQVKSVDDAILPGVVLFLGGADECSDRVRLSSGSMAAPGVTRGGPYEDGAMIPRPGWRGLTTTDRKTLIAESCPTFYGNAISVIGLPLELLKPFRPLRVGAAECRSPEQLLPIIDSDDCSTGTEAIVAYLQQHLQGPDIDEDRAVQGGIAAHLPRLQTVTTDPNSHAAVGLHRNSWFRVRPPRLQTLTADHDTRDFVGLHVDSWSRNELGLSHRDHFPNRVCVNLGADDRFFLFINIPVSQMDVLTEDKNTDAARAYGPSSLAIDFMRSFPSYPVVRVRIRPGEGYVAPTENIAHDGSSIDMNAIDVTLSVRGYFGLCLK
jgi:hypothetical protein